MRPFFVVNNTLSSADPGVQKLRQKINELFQLEPYMGEDVPIRWFSFEKVAEALVEKKTTYLELDQLERIVREVCLIEDETEVASMLNFYHDLGVIIKYGSTVVLQAQWLIDLFKKLITIRPYDEQVSKDTLGLVTLFFCIYFVKYSGLYKVGLSAVKMPLSVKFRRTIDALFTVCDSHLYIVQDLLTI